MERKAKFKFYEIVRISAGYDEFSEISGLEGAVLGMAESDGNWFYSVSIFDTSDVWNIPETVLISTGKQSKREDFYDGSSVSVSVDKDTGRGDLS